MNYIVTRATKEIDTSVFIGEIHKFFNEFVNNCGNCLVVDISLSSSSDSIVELIEVKSIDEKFSVMISFGLDSKYEVTTIKIPFRSTSFHWQFNTIDDVVNASNYALQIYNEYNKSMDRAEKEIIKKFDKSKLFV